MSQQTKPVNTSEPVAFCLIIISGDPRGDQSALEGIRCATGMAGDSRWKVTIGFCEDALDFVRDFTRHPEDSSILCNLVLKQWVQTPGSWYYLKEQRYDAVAYSSELSEKTLDASAWLQLGMLQSHILCFGRSF